MVTKQVQKWAPAVQAELQRVNVPLPVDLILSVIHTESRGKAGLVNKTSGASGLTQIMPNTLVWYNENHQSEPVELSELRSSSDMDAIKQIRVGVWVLAKFWKGAFNYLSGRLGEVPIDELARIADLFYVAGPGATKKRLDKLDSPTWAAVQAHFPTWAALPHPRNVFSHLEGLQWPLEAISNWLKTGKILGMIPSPEDGFVIAVLGILVAWYLLRGKGPDDGKAK
jgi:hypothetical protein